MKKSNWEITLEYAERHKWQMRLALASVLLSIVKSDVAFCVGFIIKQILK